MLMRKKKIIIVEREDMLGTDEKKQQIRQKIKLSNSVNTYQNEYVGSYEATEFTPDLIQDTDTNRMSYNFEEHIDEEEKDNSEDGVANALGLLLIYGVIMAAPHVKRWWENKAFPGIQKFGKRISSKKSESKKTKQK